MLQGFPQAPPVSPQNLANQSSEFSTSLIPFTPVSIQKLKKNHREPVKKYFIIPIDRVTQCCIINNSGAYLQGKQPDLS
jgi:hypothetical protein